MLGYLQLSEAEIKYLVNNIKSEMHWPLPMYPEDAGYNQLPIEEEARSAGGPKFRLLLTSLWAVGQETDGYPLPFFPTLAELNLLDMFLGQKDMTQEKLSDGTPLVYFMDRLWAEQRRLNAVNVPTYIRSLLALVVPRNEDEADNKYTDDKGLSYWDHLIESIEDQNCAS